MESYLFSPKSNIFPIIYFLTYSISSVKIFCKQAYRSECEDVSRTRVLKNIYIYKAQAYWSSLPRCYPFFYTSSE